MKTPMNEQIQAVILAVQSYRTFLWNDAYVRNASSDFKDRVLAVSALSDEHIKRTKDYYESLPLPDGMEYNNACFEAVLYYPIDRTLNTEMSELPSNFLFGY